MSLFSYASFSPLTIQGKISSSYFLANNNISRPVDVVHAAIFRLATGDVPAPSCPYKELAVIFTANCFASKILYLNGSFSLFISFFTNLRSFNRFDKIVGITPSFSPIFANLIYLVVPSLSLNDELKYSTPSRLS